MTEHDGALRSALYVGRVTHHRAKPRVHDLVYTLFYALIDLDELPRLVRPGLFGWNARALMSFRDRDHGHGDGRPFREVLEELLVAAGLPGRRHRFEVLCLPRVAGYVFNPLSVIYCHDGDDLVAMVYEVSNTFGERVHYVLPVAAADAAQVIRQRCGKTMYVSPFFDVSGGYRFDLTRPRERLALSIRYEDEEGLRLHAGFTGQRLAWTTRNLLAASARFPFATAKVIAGIHWEALRLWLKGLPLHPRPTVTEHHEDVRPVRH